MRCEIVRRVCICLALALYFSACAPRGETKSVDEIYQAARERFAQAYSSAQAKGMSAEVSKAVSDISTVLQGEVAGIGSHLEQVTSLLASLQNRAGYTSRATLAELVAQYSQLGGAAGEHVAKEQSAAVYKLLASRTLSLLSAELETTRFAVS